jgi:hypothetical protein
VVLRGTNPLSAAFWDGCSLVWLSIVPYQLPIDPYSLPPQSFLSTLISFNLKALY